MKKEIIILLIITLTSAAAAFWISKSNALGTLSAWIGAFIFVPFTFSTFLFALSVKNPDNPIIKILFYIFVIIVNFIMPILGYKFFTNSLIILTTVIILILNNTYLFFHSKTLAKNAKLAAK